MARPRIFVSSTFYDLKHIRSSLDVFIQSLGYDSILSEKGDIAYAHDIALDESCYREVGTADIFVLIIGGRYGSAASQEEGKASRTFFERYESVTKMEHSAAIERDIPIFILIETAVYGEYKTYLRNKGSDDISYAHVDSVNVFAFIDEILTRRRNNPIHTFERFSDIESWLREQWAGLFREYLRRTSGQQQLAALTEQVTTLQEVSSTLKRYLEEVVSKVSPDGSAELIRQEEARLHDLETRTALRENTWVFHVIREAERVMEAKLSLEDVIESIKSSNTLEEYLNHVREKTGDASLAERLEKSLMSNRLARHDFNLARALLGMPQVNFDFLDTSFFSEPRKARPFREVKRAKSIDVDADKSS